MRNNKPTHNSSGKKLIWFDNAGFTQEQINEWQEYADSRNLNGPSVKEHPEDFNGECYCQLCLSYM